MIAIAVYIFVGFVAMAIICDAWLLSYELEPIDDQLVKKICDDNKLTIEMHKEKYAVVDINGEGLDRDDLYRWGNKFIYKHCSHKTLDDAKRWIVDKFQNPENAADGQALFGYGIPLKEYRKQAFEDLMSKMCELENQGKKAEADKIYDEIVKMSE